MSAAPPPSLLQRIVRPLTAGFAGALLAALGLLTVAWIQRHLLGISSWRWWSRDQVWMIPLGYLMVFAPLAVLLTLAHLVAPRRVSLTTVGAVVVTVATFATLLFFGRIAPAAWAVVAIGIGLQSRSWLARTGDQGWRWWRGTALALGVGFALAGGWNLWNGARLEARAVATLPRHAPGAPNVLLIILDTVRRDGFRLTGGDSATVPALGRRLQSGGGIVFDSAYSTAPWTLPSHASMFTGRYASQQSGDWDTPLNEAPRTLAEVFRENGYATGGFTANQLATGYRTGLSRGFGTYRDVVRRPAELLLSTTLTQSGSFWRAWRVWQDYRWRGRALQELLSFDLRPNGSYQLHERKRANVVAKEFLDWQGTLGDRPFFAFVNLFDAHAPYEPPAPYDTLYASGNGNYRKYLGGIRYMDDVIERTLCELDARGALHNTLVIVASDHGELFGEHGLRGHGNSLYRPLLHVPLVIVPPVADSAERHVQRNISLRDLAATILDLAGAHTQAGGIEGTSLVPLMHGEARASSSPIIAEVNRSINTRTDTPTADADLKTVVDDTLQVIVSSAGAVEAFQYRRDPLDSVDVAAAPANRRALRSWMDQVLTTWRVVWPNGRSTGGDGRAVSR